MLTFTGSMLQSLRSDKTDSQMRQSVWNAFGKHMKILLPNFEVNKGSNFGLNASVSAMLL